MYRTADERLLDRAPALGRVLFTQDEDLLAEVMRRQEEGVPFADSVSGAYASLI
jgi:predicted nuclease of predicted toxin-antitoxin system